MSSEVLTLEVRLPRGSAVATMPGDQRSLLTSENLMISFFNMSGQVPIPDEFEPAADWPDEERMRMLGKRPLAELRRKVLTAAAGCHPTVDGRLATGKLKRRRGYYDRIVGADDVWESVVVMEHTGWVTHFAIGTKEGKLLWAAEFDAPTPFMKGAGFNFGLRLRELVPALPEPEARKALDQMHQEVKVLDAAKVLYCASCSLQFTEDDERLYPQGPKQDRVHETDDGTAVCGPVLRIGYGT